MFLMATLISADLDQGLWTVSKSLQSYYTRRQGVWSWVHCLDVLRSFRQRLADVRLLTGQSGWHVLPTLIIGFYLLGITDPSSIV